MKTLYLTLIFVLLTTTSCMTQNIYLKKGKGDIPGRIPDGEIWAHYILLGFIPIDAEINAAQVCKGKRVESIEDTETAIYDQPWNLFIGYIWYSRSLFVYCTN